MSFPACLKVSSASWRIREDYAILQVLESEGDKIIPASPEIRLSQP